MLKKSIIALSGLLIVGIFAFFIFLKINGDPLEYEHLETDVRQYLATEQGYQAEDILKLEVKYVAMKLPAYHAEVVLKDEPDKTYYFCEVGEEEDKEIVPCREDRDEASDVAGSS